jgi:preprotein translocase subunit YajC
MELSAFIITMFCMVVIANIIYSKILYPQMKEAEEEQEENS